MGKFALIIGNSEYEDPNLARLTAPGEDVNDLAAVLRAPAIGGFDQVTTLVNELSATIRRAIARFFALKTADDLLLLYFSGHGVLDDRGELFLATKDTERDLVRGTAIPASYITGEMDGSRSRRQVLVLDCCHSGAFTRGSKGVVGASVGTASAFEGTGYGRVVLTATDATQFAWEGDRVIGQAENSLFTHYLIQGLQTGEADIDADGRITLDNLYDYVYGQVVKATPKQTPGKWSYKQQGDIVIASNPKPVIKPAELPRELRDAIESPFAGVREGAVRELDRLLHGSQPGLALAALDALKQLTEDDSNRVKNAALGVVNAYEEAKSAKERTLAQGEQERIAREQADAARLERERAEQERLAKEDAERERVAREKAEQERISMEKAKAERVEREKEEAARVERERAEQERVAKENAERERVAREKAEQERISMEKAKAEQRALEKVEQERLARERTERAESIAVAPVTVPERKAIVARILQNRPLLIRLAGITALILGGIVIAAVGLNAIAPKPNATPLPTPVVALLPTAAPSATAAPSSTSTSAPTSTPPLAATKTPTAAPSSTATGVPAPSRAPATPAGPLVSSAVQRRGTDNAEMVNIPAGEFTMGSNSGLDDDAAPEHKVFVDAFWIDKYEVTNGQYSKCVDAKKCSRIEIITKAHYDDSPNFGSPQFDSYPVIYSFWDDADSYCKWAGKRLPTEAEWEKAARGTDARIYPWGNAFDGTKLNSSIVADAYTTTAPVGSFPSGVSPYGVYDMAGNVWEYVADWYAKDYYKSSPAINPKGPPTSAEHVVRGGSWDSGKTDIYTVTRTFFWPPEARFGDLGFRCAQNP